MNMTKFFISVSSHFKLCVAVATHNFNWLKITYFFLIWGICKFVSTHFNFNNSDFDRIVVFRGQIVKPARLNDLEYAWFDGLYYVLLN